MRNLTRVSCTGLLLAGFLLRGWANGPDLQSRLLAEPIWTFQPADGPAIQLWFERSNGAVGMVRCIPMRPECRNNVDVDADGLTVKELDGRAVRLELDVASVPIFSGSGASLFPAWVVPTAVRHTGH